jgi:ABC-2 type transport system permease protein
MGQMLFGVVMKSGFWLLVLASSIYLLVALNLGFLISVLTKSQLVANQLALLISYLPSLLLSDFVFPIVNMPEIIKWTTYIVPARYFIDILNGLYLRGIGLEFLWPSYLVLTFMLVVISAVNFIVLKREGM